MDSIEKNNNEYRNEYGYTNSLQMDMNSIPFIETSKINNTVSEYQPSMQQQQVISETTNLTQELRGLVNNINNEQLVDEMIEKMANGIDVFNENTDTSNYNSNRTLGMINSKVLLALSVLLIVLLVIIYIIFEIYI